MKIYEIASEITKTAIENNSIRLTSCATNDETVIENTNTFNAKQISDFYKTIYNAVLSAGE